jgi:hypothetical protein
MAITHKFKSAIPDDPDATLVRPSNWNDSHDIDRGIATLDASGTTIVTNANTPTWDRIILHRQSGNSGMPIYVSEATEETSFTIISKGEADDTGLQVPFSFL